MPDATRTPAQPCPTCGAKLDACSRPNADGLKPRIGDVTVCLHCSTALQFGIGMALVPASDEALIEIASDPEFRRANDVVAAFSAFKAGKNHDA